MSESSTLSHLPNPSLYREGEIAHYEKLLSEDKRLRDLDPSSVRSITGNGSVWWYVNKEDELLAYNIGDLKVPVAWAPQKGSQEAYLSCPVREVLYCGTRGPGKTDALLMDFLQHVGQGFGEDWRGIIFRQSFPDLKDLIAKSRKFVPKIFPTAVYNKQDKTWTFDDGEQLIFAFAETIDDYDKYHGHNYPFIGWEELTNWADDKLFKRMISTNRSARRGLPQKIRATCNPSGPGHNWVKARYNLPCPPGQYHTGLVSDTHQDKDTGLEYAGMQRIAIHGHVRENLILLHAQPDYIETIRASCSSPAEEAAWVDGSWDITSGGMFDDIWDPRYHIVNVSPDMIPDGWRIDRSYDHGQSKPFSVGFWAQSNGEPIHLPDGRTIGQVRGDLVRIEEWYGWTGKPDTGLRMTAEEIAVGIQERIRDMGLSGRVRPGVADGAIFDQWEPGKSVAGDMRKKGIKWLPADKGTGSRAQGWQQVRKMLKAALPTKTEGGNYIREAPGLFVSHRCRQFLRTFPVLPRDKKKLDDVDTDAEDHIADEVRYRCRAKRAKRAGIRKV